MTKTILLRETGIYIHASKNEKTWERCLPDPYAYLSVPFYCMPISVIHQIVKTVSACNDRDNHWYQAVVFQLWNKIEIQTIFCSHQIFLLLDFLKWINFWTTLHNVSVFNKEPVIKTIIDLYSAFSKAQGALHYIEKI